MRPTPRRRSSWAFPFLALSLIGCERGCAREWLASHGLERDLASGRAPGSLRLGEVDCPAGLVRCVDGSLEVAGAFRHPEPCTGPAERCTCPWDVVGCCAYGCITEELALPIEVSQASKRLCAPSPSSPSVATAPLPDAAPPDACGDERYRCVGSRVVGCDPPPRVIAVCARGCAGEGETLDDESVSDPQAVSLLCDR